MIMEQHCQESCKRVAPVSTPKLIIRQPVKKKTVQSCAHTEDMRATKRDRQRESQRERERETDWAVGRTPRDFQGFLPLYEKVIDDIFPWRPLPPMPPMLREPLL